MQFETKTLPNCNAAAVHDLLWFFISGKYLFMKSTHGSNTQRPHLMGGMMTAAVILIVVAFVSAWPEFRRRMNPTAPVSIPQ